MQSTAKGKGKRSVSLVLIMPIVLMIAGGCSVIKTKSEVQKNSVSQKLTSKYDRIVADSTRVADGLFGVYRSEGKYFFDIPMSLMGRDFLVVNRVLQVPPELNDAGINRGINYENTLISFSLSEDKKDLLVTNVKPTPYYPEGDAIGLSVLDNFRSPLMARIPIHTLGTDSTSVLVDMTQFFDGSSSLLNHLFDMISVGGNPDRELSRIVRVSAFPTNVTVVSDYGTKVNEGRGNVFLTVQNSSSFVLLPEQPMRGRVLNPRVGYFAVPRTYYSDAQTSVKSEQIITRWRLEPSDPEAYLRGELVEPVQPIVFHLDKSTPVKWRKYIKKGIEDWQVAFERAGFKNAIIAREVDEEINHDDLSISGINYIASDKMNAMGPSVYDPRSGEIIQADIIWWHNVLTMLRNWIVLQTGATQEGAAQWNISDELLGDAMRFVACHEVGHSLGLRHNMIASSAYSIAELRDPVFTAKHGTSPSIMDYARFNYVAQPGDGVKHFSPQIGAYDILAIEYAYRWYGDGLTKSQEEAKLQELLGRHTGKLYRYSEAQDSRAAMDPRAQTEDLSDDPVTASELGIRNLKRILPKLENITANGDPHQGYDELGVMLNTLINQWNTFVYHPLALIGGMMIDLTDRSTPNAETYSFVSREEQERALDFLIRETITDVDWLFDAPAYKRTYPIKQSPSGLIEQAPSLLLKNAQSYIFWDLLDDRRLVRMSENEWRNGSKALSPTELTSRLFDVVFGKSAQGRALTVQERVVQKGLVDALIQSVSTSKVTKKNSLVSATQAHEYDGCCALDVVREINFHGSLADRISDAISVKRGLLDRIYNTIKPLRTKGSQQMRGHYIDMVLRIENAFEK